jgi:hypothetical protein
MTPRSVRMALLGTVLAVGACAVMAPPAPMPAAQECRQFTQTITVNGQSQPGYGWQCLQPDGTWAIAVPPTATPTLPPVVSVPVPAYVYPPAEYWYPDVYPWEYPWYFGPDVFVEPGFGWGGSWYGWRGPEGRGGEFHGGEFHGGGAYGGGGHGGAGHGGGGAPPR